MSTYRSSRIIAATCEEIFDLVADVESYPEFLDLWTRARIVEHGDVVYRTEQEVGLGPIRERFVTRTELRRPDMIEVTSDDALFRAFRIRWDFTPQRRGCRVSIALTWDVHSRLLQKAIDRVLRVTAQRMISAFEVRARAMRVRRL